MKTFFTSRTNWTIVVLFLVSGVAGVHGYIPPAAATFIDGLLSILAMYFKMNPSQQY